ncbi:MAG TPA: zinc ribbon domain-containing protein [Thermoguttaceae bacterium]|nr:zinc ribbon domain-containing protein [Thermoguttaceae bacterium]
MPIYEYVCQACGREFEELLRGDEKPACPSCGKRRLKQQFSVAAAHAEGSQPSCPARETGACGVSNCAAGGCGLAHLT